MSDIRLHRGDNRDSLRRLIAQGVRVHSVVTDPPYGLVSITKRFGKEGSAPARREGNDGSFARLSGGFMNQKWDATGIERDPEFWRLIYDILLPGGYVFAFSGSRTGHWQAVAMDQAGFIMHPMHGWVFGSGFPKAHAADKAIDKLLGAERDRIPVVATPGWQRSVGNTRPYMFDPNHTTVSDVPATAAAAAAAWEGWAYGTQAEKPALEPIYLAQKPYSEKTGAANLLKHGVGAVNIDGCRVPTNENLNGGAYAQNPTDRKHMWGVEAGNSWRRGGAGEFVQPEGRHPSNLILDGSPEVVALFPNGKSGKPGIMRKGRNDSATYGAESRAPGTEMTGYGDEGSNARFFHQFPLTDEDYHWAICAGIISEDQGDPIIYNAKANKTDRAGSKHPTVKPVNLLQYLIRHITPPGGVVLDPFAGSGTTAEAARREGFDCILMEAEKNYADFIHTRFKLPDNADTDQNENIGLYSFDDLLEDAGGPCGKKEAEKDELLIDDMIESTAGGGSVLRKDAVASGVGTDFDDLLV